jgi:hypothetical protein
LREEWEPQGVLEEILIEKIAMNYYRLHIAYGYEAEFSRSPADFFQSIDRTSRYATSISRQLTQDVNQFERLKQMRKSEFVPASLMDGLISHTTETDETSHYEGTALAAGVEAIEQETEFAGTAASCQAPSNIDVDVAALDLANVAGPQAIDPRTSARQRHLGPSLQDSKLETIRSGESSQG